MANRTDRAVRRHSYTFCHRPPGVLRLPLSIVFTSAFCFDFGTVFLCLPYYYTPKSRFCQFVLLQNFEKFHKENRGVASSCNTSRTAWMQSGSSSLPLSRGAFFYAKIIPYFSVRVFPVACHGCSAQTQRVQPPHLLTHPDRQDRFLRHPPTDTAFHSHHRIQPCTEVRCGH